MGSRDKYANFEAVYNKAVEAGMAAGNAAAPTPMVVGTPTTPFGNEIDRTKPVYLVADGVCGFAWVTVRPGNSSFAKWLVKNKIARADHYYGGVTFSVPYFNQSMIRKEAYANAVANVLRDELGVKAYANSRMD